MNVFWNETALVPRFAKPPITAELVGGLSVVSCDYGRPPSEFIDELIIIIVIIIILTRETQ